MNTSSIAGLLALQGAADYIAAKHAVIGFTRPAALDYAKHNIRINAVPTGVIKTKKMLAKPLELKPQLHGSALTAQRKGSLGIPSDVSAPFYGCYPMQLVL